MKSIWKYLFMNRKQIVGYILTIAGSFMYYLLWTGVFKLYEWMCR